MEKKSKSKKEETDIIWKWDFNLLYTGLISIQSTISPHLKSKKRLQLACFRNRRSAGGHPLPLPLSLHYRQLQLHQKRVLTRSKKWFGKSEMRQKRETFESELNIHLQKDTVWSVSEISSIEIVSSRLNRCLYNQSSKCWEYQVCTIL